MLCQVCGNGVIGRLKSYVEGAHPPNHEDGTLERYDFRLAEYWPKVTAPNVPGHTPDNIASFFAQGIDSLRRQNLDAAGMMFRKCIEATTKRLKPDGRGTLRDRIDALAENHTITPALKDWAHHIRIGGNDAAHNDDPFEKEDAEALKGFTELFLMYVFTLPGMLTERMAPAMVKAK